MDIRGADDIISSLDKLTPSIKSGVVKGLKRAVLVVHREAVRNAPISPTIAQANAAGIKANKNTSPGGLEGSISFNVDNRKMEASVFIASNSRASKYAKKMHDEKGKSWNRRGVGTTAKGNRADDKYIERAVEDNKHQVFNILSDELRKVGL